MGYEAAFVDQVASSPTVRLDLAGTGWTIRLGTEFGMPELRRAVVSSLLADGDRYPAAAYGNRTLRLVLRYDAASEDDIATGLQALYRELDRATNILRWRPDTTKPVFFRTFRCPPEAVNWDPFTKEAICLIPAEPFAVGLRETLSVPAVVNDPAGIPAMDMDLGAILGDVETPLCLKVRRLGLMPDFSGWSPLYGRRTSVFGLRRGGTPSQTPVHLQAEAMTSGTDTSVQAVAGASGGSVQRCTFGTVASLESRLTIAAHPSTATVDARGQYRLFVRVKKSVSADVIRLRVSLAANDADLFGDAVTLPSGTVWRWVDLGLVQLPVGYDPAVDGLSGAPLTVEGATLAIYAERVSGSGNVEIDSLMFMPADDRMLTVKWPAFSDASQFIVDSAVPAVYSVTSGGGVSGSATEVEGLGLMVSPGMSNRIWMIRDAGSDTAAGDDITASTSMTELYYWPRYLYVRGASS